MKPKSNRVFARYKFHQKVQQEGESFEQFLTDLKLLVKDCGYGDLDQMFRDRVVIECHSTKTREKLIQEGLDLTLEKAIDIARTAEMSKTQLETMASEDASINGKYRVKSVTNVDINMATRNVTQKESDVPSAKS